MNLKQLKTQEAGHRVKTFRNANPTAINWPLIAREEFDANLAALDMFGGEQYTSIGSAKGETAVQDALRRQIYTDFLGPIRINAEFWKVADSALVVDSYIERQGEWEMKVEALANAAEKYPVLLNTHMGRPDFVVELRALLAKLRGSVVSRNRNWGNRSGATDGIKAAEREVRDAIRVIDSAVSGQLSDNPALLAAWKSACRIHKTRVDPRPGGDATPNSPE